jgi:transcriptional regulator with PAS, ATPase and Fis domain
MKETLSRTKVIAELDTTVLLTGESGTGKTTIARYIHQLSSVSSGPFIPVSCASIPRELLEAELFGHEKGSFTGAAASRPGLVELANKGTLFLDEVGDLPLDLQPKILTFLQDRSARRVGGRQQYSVDVRVIAATNRDLRQICIRQEFREDLFYRLNVISLEVPPLRSRRDDIPALISSVLDNIAKRRGAASYRLAAPALDSAIKYNWPGNVRELENVLERASAFAKDTTLSAEELGLGREAPLSGSTANLSGLTMAELETRAIRDTLETTGGDKAAAAKMLGISLKTIYNKINKYGI